MKRSVKEATCYFCGAAYFDSSHPRNGGDPNWSIFRAVWFCFWWVWQYLSLSGVPVCLHVRVCVYVEPIFLANRLSNCWPPVAKSLMVLLFTVLAGKDIADKWFLLLSKWKWTAFVLWVSPSWTGIPPSKQESKMVCRKMFIIQLLVCLRPFWF